MVRVAAAFLVFVVTSTAMYASDEGDCASGSPSKMFAACSRIISKQGMTNKQRADAYAHRAWAYNAKSDHRHVDSGADFKRGVLSNFVCWDDGC